MKYFFCLFALLLFSCRASQKINAYAVGKIVMDIQPYQTDSSFLSGSFFDYDAEDKLNAGIVIVDKKVFRSDSLGNFKIALLPGRYQILVSLVGYYPVTHVIDVRKGDFIKVGYYAAHVEPNRYPLKK